MNKSLSLAALVFCSAGAAFASIDGTVLNRTTGQPQPGVHIMLVKPGQGGMRTIGSTVSDASGHFLFQNDEPGGGPQLLQARYKDIDYNKLMTPNLPTSGVELDVFDATKSPAVARIEQQVIFFEPSTSRISVEQTVRIQNQTNTTYHNSALGDFRFYLPPAANGQVRVNAQGPQGMPLPRPAEKTEQANVFKVDFPIKPGESQFDLSYVLPVGSPFTFRGRIVNVKGMPAGPLRLAAPAGVTLAGTDITQLGTEPKTQATVYNVTAPRDFTVDITGTGSLRSAGDAETADTSDEPQLTEGAPKIYTHMGWLVAVAFSILAVGLLVLFRSSPVRSPYGK